MNNLKDNPVDPIDLSIFKEHTTQRLLNILGEMPKYEKTLVLERSLISKLNYITTLEPLIEKLVNKNIQTIDTFSTNSPIVVFLITSKISNLEIINKYINNNLTQKQHQEFHIIFTPKINNECSLFIEKSELKKYYKIHNLTIDIFSLDYDIFSIEDHDAFKDLYILSKYDCLSILKRTIIKYETAFGKIKYKYSKGPLAKKLNDLLTIEEEFYTFDNELETLACFIFDRTVDMITPFCTQFTYEALLDEYIGINFNSIKVSPKLLEKDSKLDMIKIDLSNNDKFYTKIKDFNFNKIRTFLPNRLKEHSQILEIGKQQIGDIRKIQEDLEKVQKVQEERVSLANHINLADFISSKQKPPIYKFYLNFELSMLIGDSPPKLYEFIENEIGKKNDEYNILRIICLDSLIHGGIYYKYYEDIRKDFLTVYGYKQLFLWHNLESLNILRNEDGHSYYYEANTNFKLIYEDIDINEPNDSSYAYSGYCPLMVRMIEKAVSQGWSMYKELLKKIPGDTDFPADETEISNNSGEKQFFLVVFIGGITYGELAAIRYLNKTLVNKKFIVLTTGMINYKNIFDSLK